MPRPLDVLAAAVAPDRCLHCRGPAPPGALLCHGCRQALPWLPVDGCLRCGLPAPCAAGRCPARHAPFGAAWAPLAYEGPARSLAWAGKQRSARRVARWLGAAMVVRPPVGLLDGAAAVVAVPADAARRRQRGEDHARLLAAAVAAGLGLPLRLVLTRPASRPAQHDQGRAGRAQISAPAVVGRVPAAVVLVDDVHTTGATLRSAAGALRAAGAERVVALTAFRTLR